MTTAGDAWRPWTLLLDERSDAPERIGISALGSAIQRRAARFPAGTVVPKDSPAPALGVDRIGAAGGARRVPSAQSATIGRMFERTVVPAGPRVISARLPTARSVSIAAYVLAGSRLETAGQVGVAHFMEHLTFKGTTAYPSTRAISEAIEGVGGSFNAATDRESTVYWVRVPRRETERAMDVVGELIVRPRLEAADIQSERAVIIEEIRSYLDDPSEYCQILFQTAMFGDGPLGREICGEESDILALPEAAIRDFWRAAYRPANTVVAVVGDLAHDEEVGLAGTAFGTGNGTVPGFAPAPVLPAGPRLRTGKRDTSQAQIC